MDGRGGQHRDQREEKAEPDRLGRRRAAPDLLEEEQATPTMATVDPSNEARGSTGCPKNEPGKHGIGHDQQGEHHRDQSRGDVELGGVDEIVVEHELEQAEQGREQMGAAAMRESDRRRTSAIAIMATPAMTKR